MSFIGNVLWILLAGGLVTCVEYLIAGVVLCLTIIGLPFGVQCFKLAELSLLPFGREVVPAPQRGPLSPLMNLIWLIVAGIWIAITHVVFAIGCAVTIIGIPFAIQHLKLAKLGLLPFGKAIRERP
ncbi:YccF domain-containing protein [Haliangium sp.]|uniref:YccF domain-containing protein n=1 Tax=Haliangium sp. TaxID=2663208 RepID=UPI003D09A054